VFCSPSNHRVHHAVNDPYIDKNYGGILVLWDRWFGTFQEEHEKCIYGTRGQLNSWDPVWANAEVYWALAKDTWATERWIDKIRIWFMPPGWQPADLAAKSPKAPFKLSQVKTFNPPLSSGQQWFAALQFALNLGAVSVFLWVADSLGFAQAAMASTALFATMWALGRYMQHGLSAWEVLAVDAAALATLGAVGMLPYYLVTKPLVMAIAIIFVASRAYSMGETGQNTMQTKALLIGALVFSLGGDVFLMLPGDYFIPGLASFLVAHGFYIACFSRGQSWFANRRALLIVFAFGIGMYGLLWSNLPDAALKVAVAAYVSVICLMASQAISRATELQTSASRWVAAGACIFMLSDTLIAINKFLVPVPWSAFWILLTYYAAQLLIVHFLRRQTTEGAVA
jgi:alkylglycerol monooxygenase